MAGKKYLIQLLMLSFLLCMTLSPVYADIDFRVVQELKLQAEPLDVASSDDGNYVYVLVPGEILVYSRSDKNITDRIPVDKSFNRIEYSQADASLVLTGSSSRLLNILQIEAVSKFDISGLSVRGNEKAPVLIAVFSDYQ